MKLEAPSKLQGVQVVEWLGAFCFTRNPRDLSTAELLFMVPTLITSPECLLSKVN